MLKRYLVNWFKSKLNLSLAILLGVFIVFALLSYLINESVIISLLALAGMLIVIGIKLTIPHKTLKYSYWEQYARNQLSETQVKVIKRQLRQLSFQFVMFYLLAFCALLLVYNYIVTLF